MFQSQSMSRVELVIPEHDVVPVTETLAALGSFHPTPSLHLTSRRTVSQAENWREQANTFAALERRILAVMEALDIEEGSPPTDAPHLIEPEVARMDIQNLEQEAQTPVQTLEEEQQKRSKLESYVRQLQTIADLDVDLDTVRNLHYTFAQLGTIPVENLERLETSLEFVPSVITVLRREDHLATVAIFGTQRDADILKRATRSAYFNPLKLPDTYRGTPAEAIEALEASIERTGRRIDECNSAIGRLHELRVRRLRHLLWRVRASRTLSETIAQYGRMRYTYLAAGWVPSSQVPTLQRRIQQVSDSVLIEVNTPHRQDGGQGIPVSLENPPVVRAFQGLVTNYGNPGYGELDPTLLVALTFPLIFGIMFGDVGHGLILILVGLLLASRRVKALREFAGLGTILIVCGTSSVIFGFLYGSIFGFEDMLQPIWIRPLEDIMHVLLTTVIAGVGLLSLGMLCNIANAALARRWGGLLFGHSGLTGLIFYWSLIGLAVNAFTGELPISPTLVAVAAVASGLAVTLSELLENLLEGHRPLVEGDLGTYLVQLPVEVFEMVIGLLSNTLSYVRMGAFAVAHGALSMVVFIMAEIVSPTRSLGYWVVVALGNLFVIGFEGMIVGIQTLRLEYYEFFSKFFSGGGSRYSPLELVPQGEE